MKTATEIPGYVREMVEQIAFVARDSELVDQSSGVSARLTISGSKSGRERRNVVGSSELGPGELGGAASGADVSIAVAII